MGAKTYSFKRFAIAVNNVPVEGFQDGDGVVAERAADDTAMVQGNDGETMFSQLNNTSGTITFTLLYSSLSNDKFREIAANGSLVSILIRDLVGGTKIKGTNCRVMKVPSVTLGREGGTLEWGFNVAELVIETRGLKNETATP